MARDWIEMLIDLAREQERGVSSDPRFDELLAGRLPDAEKEKLAKDATASLESRAALAACTPLGDDVKERLLKRAHVYLSTPSTGERDPLDVPDELEGLESAGASGEASNNEGRAAPVLRPRPGVRLPMFLVAAFLLAAALAAYLAWPDDATMSEYDLEVSVANKYGAVAPATSGAAVSPGDTLVLTLRPHGEGARAANASVFLDAPSPEAEQHDLHKLEATSTISGDVIHIAVPNSALTSTTNERLELVVVAVVQGAAPATVGEFEKLVSEGTGQVRVFRQRIRVAPP